MASFLSKLFRPNCDSCGRDDLRWTSADRMFQLLPESLHDRLQEGIDFLGSKTDGWVCMGCKNFGLMVDVSHIGI